MTNMVLKRLCLIKDFVDTVAARSVKTKDCTKCPKKCNDSFSEEERQLIHNAFYELGDTEKQRQYICNLVEEKPKLSTRTQAEISRRSKTKYFYFYSNNEKIAVCQGFFLKTLDISETFIRNILKTKSDHNIVPKGLRGKHSPGLKHPENNKEIIRDHIKSFPKVPSHYCRKDSSYEYLDPELNISKMYDLYTDYCLEIGIEPEKHWLYRQIFRDEFHLKFHTPRKDMCDICFKYKSASSTEKLEMQESYEKHIERKKEANKFHDDAKSDKSINFIEFDLEAVRYCPNLNAKALFYKRRLAVYNFTVYNVKNNNAVCYMWHEGVAGRGSNEVSSCILDYLKINANGKPFVLMSDTCGG